MRCRLICSGCRVLIDENLVSLGRRNALERTAFFLVHLFVRANEAGLTKNSAIKFPITQQHLADTLGMSLVHTNKTLKRLSASKAIRWKDRVFELLDLAALVAIAGEDVIHQRPRPFI
jgi:CRP/FNR family transcriptional regulator, anaerobic regulatory protein